MKIEHQITIDANEVTESWGFHGRYVKVSMNSNFEFIFSNVDTKTICKRRII